MSFVLAGSVTAGSFATSSVAAAGGKAPTGGWGLLVVLGLGVGCWLLFKSMGRHLRKARALADEADEADEAGKANQADADGRAKGARAGGSPVRASKPAGAAARKRPAGQPAARRRKR